MNKHTVRIFSKKIFWAILLLLICISAPLLYLWSEKNIDLQNERLISYMYARALSAMWSVENAIALFPDEKPEKLSPLLSHMAQQPGIAWLAIVSENGKILADSDRNLNGKYLYTASEMRQLLPESWIKGRFSPDEPDIFEAWKLLKNKVKPHNSTILFAAFNFAAYAPLLGEYSSQLRWKIVICSLTVLSFIIVAYLIFQFKLSHEHLEDAQAIALQVIKNFPEGLLVTDSAGNINFFNKNFSSLFHSPVFSPVNLRELPGKGWNTLANNLAKKTFQRTGEIVMPDKTILQITLSKIPSNSRIAGYLFLVADKTEIIKKRNKMLEERKHAALGKVAAAIAHEIRNPLGAMCGYASYLSERLQNNQQEKKIATLLIEEGQRLNNVLSEILTLTKKPDLHITSVTPAELLTKLIMLVQPDAAARNISIKIKYAKTPLAQKELFLDKDRILQSFLNILLNAISFSPPESAIHILVSEMIKHSGTWIEFTVIDSGAGINDEIIGQIFNPYFTTKSAGTGLGLTLAKNIIESHGGSLRAENDEKLGAKFTISLPENFSYETTQNNSDS